MDELKSRQYELKSSSKTTEEGLLATTRIDLIDSEGKKTVANLTLKNLEKDLRNLEKWLTLYNTDRFGVCSQCGTELEIDRILNSPESMLCARCEST